MRNVLSRFETVKDLIKFFWENKLWWLIPFVLVLIFVAILLLFAQATPAAPFLYTVF